jgi:methyl-accepting chemotaxis protein
MDQATQQNASLVEEAAAASETMQRQASDLAEAVRVFKLDEDSAPAPVRVAVPARAGAPVAARGRVAPPPQKRLTVASTSTGDAWEAF